MKDHPQRLQRILSFLEHSYVKSMNTYLMTLKRNGRLTTPNFVKILKCNKSSVYDYFKKYSAFVKVNGSPKTYELSEEGEKFVKTIETLQKWKEVSNAKTTI
jgi:predicted transcriptional regulator